MNSVTHSLDISEIGFILDKQIALHTTLRDLLQEEFVAMSTLDIKLLADLTLSKETVLGEIWTLEQLRIKAFDKITNNSTLDKPVQSVLDLKSYTSEKDFARLSVARNVLVQLVENARTLNERNMNFAETSLARIDEMKRNVLGMTSNSSKENYSSSGVRQPVQEQGGRLFSTEA